MGKLDFMGVKCLSEGPVSGVGLIYSPMNSMGIFCSPMSCVGLTWMLLFSEYFCMEQGALYIFLGILFVWFCRTRSSRCCDISGSTVGSSKPSDT